MTDTDPHLVGWGFATTNHWQATKAVEHLRMLAPEWLFVVARYDSGLWGAQRRTASILHPEFEISGGFILIHWETLRPCSAFLLQLAQHRKEQGYG